MGGKERGTDCFVVSLLAMTGTGVGEVIEAAKEQLIKRQRRFGSFLYGYTPAAGGTFVPVQKYPKPRWGGTGWRTFGACR